MVPYYVLVKYCLSLVVHFFVDNTRAQSKLELLHQWKWADFTYPSIQARDTALRSGKYIPENCLLLDVDVWQNPPEIQERVLIPDRRYTDDGNHRVANSMSKSIQQRIFVTLPRFKSGVPVTLATVTKSRRGDTTLLAPFPNWAAQKQDDCEAGITSVYRTKIDTCGTLWVLDSGRVENFSPNPKKLCPPKVLAYDLNTGDKLVGRYPIPQSVLDEDSLLVTIAVDTRDERCRNTFLYIADVTAFKLIVYDVMKKRSWRIGSNYFYPFPTHGRFNIAGTDFNLMDGILALTLGPVQNGDRQLYFHSLASVREGSVAASVVRNQSLFVEDAESSWHLFSISEPARPSQSASEDMTSSGIMFFGLLSQMALACWNSHLPFTSDSIYITYQNNETLQFPSGIKIFGDTIWILTSELQNFIAGTTRANDVKYRILVGSVDSLVYGTGCDRRSGGYLVNELYGSKLNLDTENLDSMLHPSYHYPNIDGDKSRKMPPILRRRNSRFANLEKIFGIYGFPPLLS